MTTEDICLPQRPASPESPTLGSSNSKHASLTSAPPSDLPSPTFSTSRQSSRLHSSTSSSIPGSPTPTTATTTDCAESFTSSKRPLTEVKEEELADRDELMDFEMVDAYPLPSKNSQHLAFAAAMQDSFPQRLSQMEWNLDDPEVVMQSVEGDISGAESLAQSTSSAVAASALAARRARPDPSVSALNGIANKMGSRMPSLSRKWRSRKASSPSVAAMPSLSREPSLSRAPSTRAPSFASAANADPAAAAAAASGAQRAFSNGSATGYPPTPAASTKHDSLIDGNAAASFATAESSVRKTSLSQSVTGDEGMFNDEYSYDNDGDDEDECGEHDQGKPTTPLLPPLMVDRPAHHGHGLDTYNSPLQSPSVADPSAPSALNSPMATPQVSSLPSPPLSTRPSIASFHHRQQQQQQQQQQSSLQPAPLKINATATPAAAADLVPSSEIPPIALPETTTIIAPPHTSLRPTSPANINMHDRWASSLGSANFTIQPEPYLPLPSSSSPAAASQLREHWQLARSNFCTLLQHIAERHGAGSEVYALCKEKWSEIDAQWRRNLESCLRMLLLANESVMATAGPESVAFATLAAGAAASIAPLPANGASAPNGATVNGASMGLGATGLGIATTSADQQGERDVSDAMDDAGPAPPIPPRAPSRMSVQSRTGTTPVIASGQGTPAAGGTPGAIFASSPFVANASQPSTPGSNFVASPVLKQSEVPSLNAHDSSGKFPTAANESIVGPMDREEGYVVVKPTLGSRQSSFQVSRSPSLHQSTRKEFGNLFSTVTTPPAATTPSPLQVSTTAPSASSSRHASLSGPSPLAPSPMLVSSSTASLETKDERRRKAYRGRSSSSHVTSASGSTTPVSATGLSLARAASHIFDFRQTLTRESDSDDLTSFEPLPQGKAFPSSGPLVTNLDSNEVHYRTFAPPIETSPRKIIRASISTSSVPTSVGGSSQSYSSPFSASSLSSLSPSSPTSPSSAAARKGRRGNAIPLKFPRRHTHATISPPRSDANVTAEFGLARSATDAAPSSGSNASFSGNHAVLSGNKLETSVPLVAGIYPKTNNRLVVVNEDMSARGSSDEVRHNHGYACADPVAAAVGGGGMAKINEVEAEVEDVAMVDQVPSTNTDDEGVAVKAMEPRTPSTPAPAAAISASPAAVGADMDDSPRRKRKFTGFIKDWFSGVMMHDH